MCSYFCCIINAIASMTCTGSTDHIRLHQPLVLPPYRALFEIKSKWEHQQKNRVNEWKNTFNDESEDIEIDFQIGTPLATIHEECAAVLQSIPIGNRRASVLMITIRSEASHKSNKQIEATNTISPRWDSKQLTDDWVTTELIVESTFSTELTAIIRFCLLTFWTEKWALHLRWN